MNPPDMIAFHDQVIHAQPSLLNLLHCTLPGCTGLPEVRQINGNLEFQRAVVAVAAGSPSGASTGFGTWRRPFLGYIRRQEYAFDDRFPWRS